MRIIFKYVAFESLRIMLLALLVFTAIFFVASSMASVRYGTTLSQFLRITPFIVLYVLRYTLPISLLVGATFTLGRMVADREILALRACGAHFRTTAVPLLVIGLLFSVGLYFFNDQILPLCDYARRNILRSFAREILTLQKGRNKSLRLPGHSVFCREYDGRTLKGIMIFRNDPKLPFEIIAREGKIWLSRDGRYIIITLKDVNITYYGQEGKDDYGELRSENYSIYVPMRERKRNRPVFLTMAELWKQSRKFQEQIDELSKTESARQQNAKAIARLTHLKRKTDIEFHRRASSSLTPLLFLLVGIPLPMLLNSRVKLVPPFVALMAVMLTGPMVSMATESLAENGSLDPWFAMWLGNMITLCVGIFLFWKLVKK